MRKSILILGLAQALALAMAVPARAADAGAAFTCGGIGQSEQSAMKGDSRNHDAMLTFSTPTGAYVAGVDVTVTDAAGHTVLQGRCNGPLMLLDVKHPGRYRVHADYQGNAQSKELRIAPGATARSSFVWNAS